jgi:glycerol dehydrogenase
MNELIAFAESLPEIPETFIGIGGGQACDINKAVGAHFRKSFINVPTALSSDAPTSTHSILNNDGALFDRIVHHKNPDYVVVDTEIAVKAPAFMLTSGIGDALATYIEAEASFANNNVCNAGGGTYRPTMLGMAVAKLSYEILMEKGRAAMDAQKKQTLTPEYEDVAEASILLSGLGFECTGVSIAHGLQAGFFAMPDAKPFMHGTGVGYGALVQLTLQNDARLPEVFKFCRDVGIPTCTADLGLTPENRNKNIEALIDEVFDSRWNIHNVPFKVTRQMLRDAIDELDSYAAKAQ